MVLYYLIAAFFTGSACIQGTYANQEIFVEKQPENVSIALGQNVTLECEFNVPVDCSWLRNGIAVKISQRYKFIQDSLDTTSKDCSIEISNIQEVDIGRWQCASLADSTNDGVESKEIWITLQKNTTESPIHIVANGLSGMEYIAIDINQPLIFGCNEDDDRQSNFTLEFLSNIGENWTEIVNDTNTQFVVNFGSYRCKACSYNTSEDEDECVFSKELNVTKLNRHTNMPVLLMNGMKIDKLQVNDNLHFNAICVYNLDYGYPLFYWRFKGQHRSPRRGDDNQKNKISISLSHPNGNLVAENPKELQCFVRPWLRSSLKLASVLFEYSD